MGKLAIVLLLPILSSCAGLTQNNSSYQTYTRSFTCENEQETKKDKFVITSKTVISDAELHIQIENTLEKYRMHAYKCTEDSI